MVIKCWYIHSVHNSTSVKTEAFNLKQQLPCWSLFLPSVIFHHPNCLIEKGKLDSRLFIMCAFVLVYPFLFQCALYTHLCVTEQKWDSRCVTCERFLKYWFQMKKGTTMSCLSCHGNVWNVSCAPGNMNTNKSHHASSNWQLLCFFWSSCQKCHHRGNDAFIIFTS